jgi:hypothetical protein
MAQKRYRKKVVKTYGQAVHTYRCSAHLSRYEVSEIRQLAEEVMMPIEGLAAELGTSLEHTRKVMRGLRPMTRCMSLAIRHVLLIRSVALNPRPAVSATRAS